MVKSLKIDISKNGVNETTVKIPLVVLKIAKKLIPKKYVLLLEEKSIDIDVFLEVANNPELTGKLLQVEDHKDNEVIVFSLE